MGKPAALDTAIAEAAKLELSDAFFRRRLRRSRGFAALEDASVVVCVLPGTELSFAGEVSCGLLAWRARVIKHKTAVFRQIKKDWALGHREKQWDGSSLGPQLFGQRGAQETNPSHLQDVRRGRASTLRVKPEGRRFPNNALA
jgi:hypothetical protein